MTGWITDGGWSDERTALLREIYNSGSCAWVAVQINNRTGSKFSRNAIIGKSRRLGLDCKRIPRAGSLPRKPREKKIGYFGFRPCPRLDPEIIEETPVPQEFLGISFKDLKRGQCHFPRGEEPPYAFCGQPVKEDSSYCPACHRLTHAGRPQPKPEKYWPSKGQKVRAA